MTPEPVGSLAEEAAKLIAVMQSWAGDHGPAPSTGRTRSTTPEEPESGTTSEESAADADAEVAGADGATEQAERPGSAEEADHTDHAQHADHADHAQHADHWASPECRWCPLCQLVRVAKTTTPEVREHLTTAAMSLALAFKGLMDAAEPARERSQPVEKIDLDLDSPED